MLTDEDVYYRLSAMLPESLDKDFALGELEDGEPEGAIIFLLCDAKEEGVLTPDVLDFVDSEFPSGNQVRETSESLRKGLRSTAVA